LGEVKTWIRSGPPAWSVRSFTATCVMTGPVVAFAGGGKVST
jgi:hypothetical protein